MDIGKDINENGDTLTRMRKYIFLYVEEDINEKRDMFVHEEGN